MVLQQEETEQLTTVDTDTQAVFIDQLQALNWTILLRIDFEIVLQSISSLGF